MIDHEMLISGEVIVKRAAKKEIAATLASHPHFSRTTTNNYFF